MPLGLVLLAWAIAGRPSPVGAQTIREDFHITNGTVNATALTGDTLVIGGSFTHVGPVTGCGVPLDSATAAPVVGFPHVIGQVNVVVPDGLGGWYLGGLFTSVGGFPRNNLAHVGFDQSVSPWDPGSNNIVRALAVSGGVVYAGGEFTSAGGQSRNRLAAIDSSTGLATSWNPGPNGTVRALVARGSIVYAGGDFSTIGAQSRNRIAALDSASGLATAWNPSANSSVRAIALAGDTMLAGGDFLSIGGQSRNRIAALDLATGLATSWNPGANGQVLTLAIGDGVVYAGGVFTALGGQARSRLGAIDLASGAATGWNPSADGTVSVLAARGGIVYAGGDFLTLAGQARSRIAALDAGTGAATAWDPTAYNSVLALATDGPGVFAGGTFTGMGGEVRRNLASIDLGTGQVTGWNPDVDNQVLALLTDQGTVYVGGGFASVGGQVRNNLAAVDAVSGAVSAWNPNADGQVSALALRAGVLYAGGAFTAIGGQSRARIAALSPATGLASPWNPGLDGQVFSIDTDGTTVYMGGTFANAGGQVRNNLAAASASTGVVTAWNPDANGTIRSLVLRCATVYTGGFFTTLGAQARNRVAALDASSGIASGWNPNANGPVFDVVPADGTVYVAGVLNLIGGQVRNRIASLSAATGLATAWNPNVNGTVRKIATRAGALFAAGSFTAVGTAPQSNIAAMGVDSTVSCPTITLSPTHLPDAAPAVAYNQSVTATGGAAPYCYAVTAGALPPGFALNHASGAISGTPNTAGTFAFTLTASDGNGCSGSAACSLTVACPVVSVQPGALPDGIVGVSYSDTLSASGGAAPYTWSIASGSLPAGVSLIAGTGALVGTPDTPGNATFTVRATDVHGCSGDQFYDVTIFATPPTSLVAANTEGICISSQHPCVSVPIVFTRSDSAPVRSMSVTFHIDPARLALCTPGNPSASVAFGTWLAGYPNRNMTVTSFGGGTYVVDMQLVGAPCGPTAGGELFRVSVQSAGPNGVTAVTITNVRVRDCANAAVPAINGPPGWISVHDAPLALEPASVPGATVGSAYSVTFTNSQGLAPITFAVTSGALPAGLVLAPNGTLSGTPHASGTFAFSVTATDAGGCTGTHAYSLGVVCPAIAVLPATLPDAIVGVVYDRTLYASTGIPPLTFAVTSGALPTGLTLAANGALTGAPRAAGAFAFTVTVTDSAGCQGQQAYGVSVTCPALAFAPAFLPDAFVGSPYSVTLAASGGTAPYTWTVTTGMLPPGLTLDGSSGEISGVATSVATENFTVTVTDSNGCAHAEDRTLDAFDAPPASSVAASADTLCLSSANATVRVPIVYTRGESAAVRLASVTFQLEAGVLALATPGTPANSIHVGTWLAGFGNTLLVVHDNGGGSYTVDQAILGSPCGPTTGGTLFSVDVQAIGDDGTGTVTVTSVRVRDCANAIIPTARGPAALVPIDHAAPAAVSDLAAIQVLTGNPAGATTGITLSWSTGGVGNVRLYRAPFGSYPFYDDPGPVSPPNPALAPGAPWTLVASDALSPTVDHPPVRGAWHYVALVSDACGNSSAVSNMTPGALNYHLGDVSDGITPGQGDNRVANEDLSMLGANYGIVAPLIAARGVGALDVGPTIDLLPTSRPVTDGRLDFEDLMVFTINYQVVSAPPAAAHPTAPGGSTEAFALVAPALVSADQTVQVPIRLAAAGRLHGFSLRMGWDPTVVQPVSVRSSGVLEQQAAIVLSAAPGTVDAAQLGDRPVGISGEGEVAVMTFRALRDGDPGFHIAELRARDRANQPLPADAIRQAVETLAPTVTELLPPWPNPSGARTTLLFSLERAGPVELAIYGVDGRRVRTLASGARAPGVYRITWEGNDERGVDASPGVYYVKFTAGGRQVTRSLVHLR